MTPNDMADELVDLGKGNPDLARELRYLMEDMYFSKVLQAGLRKFMRAAPGFWDGLLITDLTGRGLDHFEAYLRELRRTKGWIWPEHF